MNRGIRNLDLNPSSLLFTTYVVLMKLKLSEVWFYQQNGYNSTYLQVVVKITSKAPTTMPDIFQTRAGSLSSTPSDFQLGNGAGADTVDCSKVIFMQLIIVLYCSVTSSYTDCSLEYSVFIINQMYIYIYLLCVSFMQQTFWNIRSIEMNKTSFYSKNLQCME